MRPRARVKSGARSGGWSPEPADLRRRAVAAAYCDGSEEGKLRHRYEMAIDRSLRATIGQLMMLEKSGADLAGALEEAGSAAAAEPATAENFASTLHTEDHVMATVVAAPRPSSALSGPAAPGSLGAGEGGSIPTASAGPVRGPEAPNRAAPAGGGGRSAR